MHINPECPKRFWRSVFAIGYTLAVGFTAYMAFFWFSKFPYIWTSIPLLIGGLISVILAWMGVFGKAFWFVMATAILFTSAFISQVLAIYWHNPAKNDMVWLFKLQAFLGLMICLCFWDQAFKYRKINQN